MTDIKIAFDKYSGKYFLTLSESNVVALTFEELEALFETVNIMVKDKYYQDIMGLADDGECEGCTI